MSEMLEDAKKRKYGVGFYNAVNFDMARSCIRAAEDLKSPIIIGTAEGLLGYSDFDWVAPMSLEAARNAKVPVAVHLDHAYQKDTVLKALRYGFGSVMFDGSSLPIDENIKISAELVEIAHAMGAGVECELGKVGGLAEGEEGEIAETHYTETKDVAMFMEKTGVDFLAISIGTTHGVFKEPPKLDLNRLAEIRSITDTYLVLHGGSGLSDQDFKNCIAGGIQKINIFTDMINIAMETAREKSIIGEITEGIEYMELLKATENAMYDVVVHKIKTFGSEGMA